jgi:hypothetical protein
MVEELQEKAGRRRNRQRSNQGCGGEPVIRFSVERGLG